MNAPFRTFLVFCGCVGLHAQEPRVEEAPPEPEDISEEPFLIEEAEAEGVAVPEEFLDAYFAERPATFLTDPQEMLGPKERRERGKFLEYHSDDAKIDFHLLLFGGHQQIPDGIRTEELVERFFGEGKPSVLVLYFLGAPERTILQLSPQIAEEVPATEQRRLLVQSIRAADEHSIDTKQLEAFCEQIAIRIYWIERAAGLSDGPPAVDIPEGESQPKPSPSRFEELLKLVKVWWSNWDVAVMTVTGGVLIALIARWFLRRRARYRFPSFEYAPRLGADYGAGVGAVIHFGNKSESPTTQRSGPDDALGGI